MSMMSGSSGRAGPVSVDGPFGAALYAGIFTLVFVDSGVLIDIDFWLPGDTILFVAGLLAADPHTGMSHSAPTSGIVLAATAGAVVGHVTAPRSGGPCLQRRHGRIRACADALYQGFGTLARLAARFVRRMRTFAPGRAGAGTTAGLPALPRCSRSRCSRSRRGEAAVEFQRRRYRGRARSGATGGSWPGPLVAYPIRRVLGLLRHSDTLARSAHDYSVKSDIRWLAMPSTRYPCPCWRGCGGDTTRGGPTIRKVPWIDIADIAVPGRAGPVLSWQYSFLFLPRPGCF